MADPMFLLQKKIEGRFSELYPNKWLPLYSQVSFSDTRYSDAWKAGLKQDAIMKKVMDRADISQVWDSKEIEENILNLIDQE